MGEEAGGEGESAIEHLFWFYFEKVVVFQPDEKVAEEREWEGRIRPSLNCLLALYSPIVDRHVKREDSVEGKRSVGRGWIEKKRSELRRGGDDHRLVELGRGDCSDGRGYEAERGGR
jgi:hypothetical protein